MALTFMVRRMIDWRCTFLAVPHWGSFAWDYKLPEVAPWTSVIDSAWQTSDEALARIVRRLVSRGQDWQLTEVVPKHAATRRPLMSIGVVVERQEPGSLKTRIACTRISTCRVWSMVDRQGFTRADVVRAFDHLEVEDVDAAVLFERGRRQAATDRKIERRKERG